MKDYFVLKTKNGYFINRYNSKLFEYVANPASSDMLMFNNYEQVKHYYYDGNLIEDSIKYGFLTIHYVGALNALGLE